MQYYDFYRKKKKQEHTLQTPVRALVVLNYHDITRLFDSDSKSISPSDFYIVQREREPLFAQNIGARNNKNFNLVHRVDTFDVRIPRILELGIHGPSVPFDDRITTICRIPADREHDR